MKRSGTPWLLASFCLALVTSPGQAVAADDYPSKPLRMITMAAAGATDFVARTFTHELSKKLGQPMVVDPRPGGGGVIGMTAAAKSAPDGYTVVLVYQGIVSVTPIIMQSLPYDTARDFVPVAQLVSYPMVLIVNPDLPAKSLQEFIRYAREKPGGMSYGSAGNATTSHLAMELLKIEAGINLLHVPYKGEPLANTDLLGGRLSAVLPTLTSALSLIRSGKVRALGLAANKRSPLIPDVPTMSEAGMPGFEVGGWLGVVAPAGTPKPILDRLSREFNIIANDPEVRARLATQAMDADGKSSEVFGKWIRDETERWRKVVTNAGIKGG